MTSPINIRGWGERAAGCIKSAAVEIDKAAEAEQTPPTQGRMLALVRASGHHKNAAVLLDQAIAFIREIVE